ncbi:MAG: MBL fold metallo-hydrolase [Chloroflexi bacterium]|nr:MBL fold metallo-hydrolase [Chloroflexota bacterium]
MILARLEVGPFVSNCYIVGSESTKEGMIIDPGADGKQILRKVESLGLDIKVIVVTHTHVDHIGALKEVKDGTGAQVAVHADDARSLSKRDPLMSMLIPGLSYPAPPAPELLLKEGDKIEVGDLSFTVLHTPGHTPGGICLVGHGVAFTGDTLFNFGIGRTDFPGGSYDQLMNSIHTRLMSLPDETVVYSGHGPESTIGDERRGNPWLRGQ